MARKTTLREAFAYFDGAKARNQRWSWSARSPDSRTVVLTLWEHDIQDCGTTSRVDMFGQAQRRQWPNRLGNKERIENLAHARDHCGGLFRVVTIVAKDRSAPKRRIAKCWPEPELVMKLIELDDTTGEFRAESVR